MVFGTRPRKNIGLDGCHSMTVPVLTIAKPGKGGQRNLPTIMFVVLWLAEMAGVPKKNVLAARRSALEAPRNLGSQCAALREAIPWAVVGSSLLGNFP
jgi:hypothetical protein